MVYTNFIATVDFGTHQIVGVVGIKNPSGSISIFAYEVEPSAMSIRRGCVSSPDVLASSIKRLLLKLENRLGGTKIAKLYIGIGGQSLRTIDNVEIERIGGVVMSEALRSLMSKCCNYRPEMLDVLATLTPKYYVDGRYEENPIGLPCNSLEARFKQVVARPSNKAHIRNIINDRIKIQIANIIPSPLALGGVVLTDIDKKEGCVLIDFGAGVTSFVIYKEGQVVTMKVIPLGGNLITQDLAYQLNISEAEAERVKHQYGQADGSEQVDSTRHIQVNSLSGSTIGQVRLKEIVQIVEARATEILENIYYWIEAYSSLRHLNAGIIITGGGSMLKNLSATIEKRLNIPVRFATIVKDVTSNGAHPTNLIDYAVAIGLLNEGKENCAKPYVPPTPSEPRKESLPKIEVPVVNEPPVSKEKEAEAARIQKELEQRKVEEKLKQELEDKIRKEQEEQIQKEEVIQDVSIEVEPSIETSKSSGKKPGGIKSWVENFFNEQL